MATIGLYEYARSKGAGEDWFIGNYYKGKVLTNLYEDIEEGIKQKWIYKADTIAELKNFFGLESLEETVETYNTYCQGGVDPQFGKDAKYLSAVTDGPFYVIQNEASGWSTIGGIRVDEALRALDGDNLPIPGLYVIGSDAGSLYSPPYYDIPGSFYGLAIDSGMIAGKEAARYAQSR